MNFREESIPLIATNQHNQFYLTREARQLLTTLDKPIAVVSIAGVYRTGKSYLVNRLLKTKQTGFQTGSTTQSVTKGLNMWGRPIVAEDENGNEMLYIVIDSEGIGSCEQQIKYDIKLLMLVFLISSTVVYNSMGAIDEVALDQLRVVVNLKQALASQPPQEKTKLVWVLRDFSLQLVDKNGCDITANQYLEQCLEESGFGVEGRKKNQIRKAIKEGLGKKSCFTLVRPTINEQDLADLSKCKLRSEFLGQIEAIREEVFSGRRQDVKRIGGSTLNGKLLLGLLQECISVLNSNGVPQIQTMWQSVRQVAYEESFEEMRSKLKREMGKLALPLSKQELKNQLNDMQNKFYNQLEHEFTELDSFKRYHKEFLRHTQKVNRELKAANSKIIKEKVVSDLREFVKNNVSFQNVEPTNLTLLKVLVDRMELKVKGEPEGYEYVLSVLFDLMHISEQKAIVLQREASEQRRVAQMGMAQRKSYDMSLMSLKQDYHQALKTINNLKVTQEQIQKQSSLYKQQANILGSNANTLQQQMETKQANFIKQTEENNLRARQRNDQLSHTIKRLREENLQLENELSQVKEERLRQSINSRKEVIFQDKIKESWEKFQDERRFLKAQIDRHRKNSDNHLNKYEEEKKYRENETTQIAKEREAFSAKEREFVQQLKEIKTLHAETKKTYCATFDALKDNDRVFRSIQNVSASNSKLASCRKATEDKDARKYYESQLDTLKNEHEQQLKALKESLEKANRLCDTLRNRLSEQETQLKLCLQEKYRLENDLMATSERFADTVSEIQTAKQRERSLYEQSIVRLLSNLDKRDSLGSHRR